ncbi:SNARE associated Golgi family protein [Bacillus coahuilensis m2-6]|uniref:TVP38/TMEM64 family membrane protein n=1 Tax=Bacillus coahuilensis p1.1.43 TaxID=1150625 RepID=A0A147K5H6_9BACI|nr:TVP38/TMEM64 family protein [Bacillus coahuilensis]KUP04516.1 SNARE associated Golgi family protein [Bacillus coahuilensis m2-6]KUP04895.1 SNARE associated Golgi family protein [Bacillus coahuilensis p1.1.43]
MKKGTMLKIGGFLLILIALIYFSRTYINISAPEIRDWILSFGLLAPIIFIVIYTVRPIILFPASILSLAGGLAFGTVLGFLYIYIGALGGATVAFFLATTFNRSIIKVEQSERTRKIREKMEESGFFYVFILRLIPLLNFDLISYLAGLAQVKYRAFILATAIGIIPGTFAFSFLGDSLLSGDWTKIAIAAAVFLVILLIPIVARDKVRALLGLNKTA